MRADVAAQHFEDLEMVTHGIHKTIGTGVVIAVDHMVWFTPDKSGGRLKFPRRMLEDVEIGARIKFVQRGDTIQKVERLSC